MKVIYGLAGMALTVVLAGCAPPAPQAPDTSAEDAAAIRAHVDEFVDAWNAGDNAILGKLVAEDAVLMQPDTPLLTGRDPILATMAEGYDIAMIQQTATCDEVIPLGDHAYARGTWTLEPTAAAGENVPGANGKWTALYARDAGGNWKLARWMWNQYGE